MAHQQRHPANPEETTSVRQSSRNSSVSMHSMSVTPTLQSVEVTVEADDDDLGKLDVPDIPTSTRKTTKLFAGMKLIQGP